MDADELLCPPKGIFSSHPTSRREDAFLHGASHTAEPGGHRGQGKEASPRRTVPPPGLTRSSDVSLLIQAGPGPRLGCAGRGLVAGGRGQEAVWGLVAG